MKVWYFVLYALYLLFGCFTLAFTLKELNVESDAIWFVLGATWGCVVANDAISRWFD